MDIRKAAGLSGTGTTTPEQLLKINKLTRRKLGQDEVYVFSVRLCDDQIDRDGERFDTAALPRLAALFIGKTGIMDHEWSSSRQAARIFDTEVLREGGVSYIKAWAYLLRTQKNVELIAEIDGGIKKEVSIGCSMGNSVCSICGQAFGSCAHQKGQAYGAAVCCAVLCDPKDAYEFSFVAVPAQPEAGVIKSWKGGDGMELAQLVEKSGDILQQDAFKALVRDAQLGRDYQKQLRQEVVRLGLVLDFGMDEAVLRAVAGRMDAEELERVKKAMEKKTAELFPAQTQLPSAGTEAGRCGAEFLI